MLDEQQLSDDRADNDNQSNNPNSGSTLATQLFQHLDNKDAKYFLDNEKQPHIEIYIDGKKKVYRVNDSKFKSYLKILYHHTFRSLPHSSIIKNTVDFVIARAEMSNEKPREFFNRVATVEQYIYQYQIGEEKAVEISVNGLKIISNTSNFRLYTHQKKQIIPFEDAKVEDIHQLFRYINVSDLETQLIIIAWLVTCLIPKIPHPIIQFYGDKGSSKSTASDFLKSLIDPSEINSIGTPNDKKEFVQTVSHSWISVIDNVSEISPSLSDMLCRMSTGGTCSKRKLYTDDEDVVHSIQRCIIINGINLVGMRSDLLDRSVLVEMEPIEPSSRKSLSELTIDFELAKPRILGALLVILSKAISRHNSIKLKTMQRMADFEKWGCAVAQVLGYTSDDFSKAYKNNIKKSYTETIEANTLIRVVMDYMKDNVSLSRTPTEVFEILCLHAKNMSVELSDATFPSSNRNIWSKLKEVRTTLLESGIRVRKDDTGRGTGRGRQIIIEKLQQDNTAS